VSNLPIINTPSGMTNLRRDTIDALSGSNGEPSGLNKFVTESDIKLSEDKVARAIRGQSAIINITASDPSAGQILTAIGPQTAAWATPAPALLRAANDFNLFPNKLSSGPGDLIIIEDAADNYTKKYLTVGTLPAPSFAKAEVIRNNTLTTTSTTDILCQDMTTTPVAGIYICFFTGSAFLGGNMGAGRFVETSIYVGDTKINGSIRQFVDQSNYYTPFVCFTVATVDFSSRESRIKQHANRITYLY